MNAIYEHLPFETAICRGAVPNFDKNNLQFNVFIFKFKFRFVYFLYYLPDASLILGLTPSLSNDSTSGIPPKFYCLKNQFENRRYIELHTYFVILLPFFTAEMS